MELKDNRRILVFSNMSREKSGACSFDLYHRFYISFTEEKGYQPFFSF